MLHPWLRAVRIHTLWLRYISRRFIFTSFFIGFLLHLHYFPRNVMPPSTRPRVRTHDQRIETTLPQRRRPLLTILRPMLDDEHKNNVVYGLNNKEAGDPQPSPWICLPCSHRCPYPHRQTRVPPRYLFGLASYRLHVNKLESSSNLATLAVFVDPTFSSVNLLSAALQESTFSLGYLLCRLVCNNFTPEAQLLLDSSRKTCAP